MLGPGRAPAAQRTIPGLCDVGVCLAQNELGPFLVTGEEPAVDDGAGFFGDMMRGLRDFGGGFGMGFAQMAAREGLMDTHAERHAREVDQAIGAGALLILTYPDEAWSIARDAIMKHPGYVVGRYAPVLVSSVTLGPVGTSMSAMSSYGSVVNAASTGASKTSVLRGLFGPF